MTRNEIQERALARFRDNNYLILEWATGVGKSRAACMIIDYICTLRERASVLLLVAETAHKDNWRKEFIKWRGNEIFSLEVDCYNSIHKHRERSYDLVIADEMHHVSSEKRMESLSNINTKGFLGLTATMDLSLLKDIKYIFHDIGIDRVGLKEAIEWKIIPKPDIYIYGMELDNTRKKETIVMEKGRKNKRTEKRCSYQEYNRIFFSLPDISLTVECTEREKCDYYDKMSDYWNEKYMRTRQEWVKVKWLRIGLERKKWLGSLKTERIKELLRGLDEEGKRYICFCSSIEQADILGSETSLHSHKDSRENGDMIKAFNNKEINSLFTVNMLQEGMNLTDIDCGILVQLDNGSRGFIQKAGRTLRGKSPEIYIFYYKNTRDEEYLDKALDLVNKNTIIYM